LAQAILAHSPRPVEASINFVGFSLCCQLCTVHTSGLCGIAAAASGEEGAHLCGHAFSLLAALPGQCRWLVPPGA